jgi:RHS repeat-associated protein
VIAPDGRGSGEYRYDVSGNLIAAPHLSGVEIAPGNKLVKANGGALTYDHRNNVSRWRRDGRELTFHRNPLDRLRRIDGLAEAWSADYDPLGRRTRKTYGAAITEYFWDTDRLAAELRPGGQLRVYVYADDFSLTPWLAIDYDSADAAPDSGKLHYLVTDQRGAPVAALDADGRRVWSARLEPYGAADVGREGDSEFELSLRLAGQFCDAETGLHYNRFRYFSPELGRYLEHDPEGTAGGYNIFAYTYCPLVQTDPRGQACKRKQAKKIIEDSEGVQGPGSNFGHAGEHIPLKGEDPQALASSQPDKTTNTVYVDKEKAFEDLRRILDTHSEDIKNLPADGQTTFPQSGQSGTVDLAAPRKGFESQSGAQAYSVTFNKATWRVCKMPDGRVHLVHFSPSGATPT